MNKHCVFEYLYRDAGNYKAWGELLLEGVLGLAEGLNFHIPKGYIYFSMAFAFLVDVIQLKTVKPASKS